MAKATKEKATKTPATKKAEQAEKPAKAAKPEKPAKLQQNGVTRPKSGTSTGKVWDICDAISKKNGKPAKRSEVMAEATSEKNALNPATIASQYARWRKFFGITKQAVAEKPESAEVEAAEDTEVEEQDVEEVEDEEEDEEED